MEDGSEVPETFAEEGEGLQGCTPEVRLAAALGAEEDPASVRSGQGVSVAWLDDLGWIVSTFPDEVLSYGPDGGFRGRLGRRGQGPEEWSRPARAVVDPTDSLWVSDLQGRAIVFAPDGTPVRTVSSPELLPIEGFVEGGRPYSVVFRPSVEDRTQGTLLARVWGRATGDAHGDVGPGAVDGPGPPLTTPMLTAPGTAASGSELYAVVDSALWLARWTAVGEDTVSTGEVVRTGLREAGLEVPVPGARPVDVTPSPEGGFWVVGVLRVLSDEDEWALREEQSRGTGMSPGALEVVRSPAIRNRVFDGILLHLTTAGEVTDAVRFDEAPLGFVSNAPQYYTLADTEAGVLQVRVWEFGRVCDGTGTGM